MQYTLSTNVIPFKDETEMREKLKSYGISLFDRKKNYKTFYYKGINVNGNKVPCIPFGIEKHGEYETLIIKVNNDYYPINFDYFNEMQSSQFSLI
jgi:hypothetical protein